MESNAPIGIFDSGVGGLTVAKAIHDLLPHEQLIYVGDTLHMPYGDRTPEHIQAYSKNIVEFLISKKVKLIVIACNSASSVASSYLRKLYWEKVAIIGVIRPVVKYILDQNIKKLGIIATHATVNSQVYPRIFKEYTEDITLYQLATPLLAPMIEQGFYNNDIAKSVIAEYLSNENFEDKEAILLACTHYPLIRNEIEAYFDNKKIIIDNAVPMANTVKHFLQANHALNQSTNTKPNEFYVSELTENFKSTATLFYGEKINIKEVDIE